MKLNLHIKKTLSVGVFLLFIIPVMLLFLSSCSTTDSTISDDTNVVGANYSSTIEPSDYIIVNENMYPTTGGLVTDEYSPPDSYLESSTRIYHVGDCSSDIEALKRFIEMVNSEEKSVQQSGYSEVPVSNDFYVVLDSERDDSIIMEKISKNEVLLADYPNMNLNGRRVNVTIVRCL